MVASGIATLTSVSKTHAVLAVGTASGGTSPYHYQWYRSSTGGFTPGAGNIISGATSTTLTDTPPGSGPWFYQNVITDSAGTPATATSNQVGAFLDTGTNLSFIAVGDSIFSGYLNNGESNTNTNGIDPITYAATMLAGSTKVRSIAFTNQAYAGTYTTDWAPASAKLNAAISAGAALSPAATIAVIEMGANDTNTSVRRSPATMYANMQATCNALVTAGFTVLVFESCYAYPGAYGGTWDNQSSGDLAQYNALLPGIDNGTTIRFIGGNFYAWSIDNYLSSTLYNTDHVHPSALGDQVLGGAIANAISNLVDPSVSGSGSTGGHIIGG